MTGLGTAAVTSFRLIKQVGQQVVHTVADLLNKSELEQDLRSGLGLRIGLGIRFAAGGRVANGEAVSQFVRALASRSSVG